MRIPRCRGGNKKSSVHWDPRLQHGNRRIVAVGTCRGAVDMALDDEPIAAPGTEENVAVMVPWPTT